MNTLVLLAEFLPSPRATRVGLFAVALFAASSLTHASVNEPTSGSSANAMPSTPAPVTPQYTDRGTTTTTVVTESYNNSSFDRNVGSNYYSGFRDGFFPGTSTSSLTIYHRPVYFPPDAPALGEPVQRRNPVALAKFAPPSSLVNYVYEPFYAPLSTLLFTEDLSRKRRDRLDAYRTSRTELLTELRSKIESLRDADPATREREFSALASQQAARLSALTTVAEDLRNNFTHGSFFESSADGSDSRNWRLGDDTRWESQIDEIKVLRAAAAFQDGLSSAQRRLLREIAMELADSLKGPTAEIALDSPGPFLYFSPATVRIRLPADLPAEISAKIDVYKTAKAALKTELRDTLYVQDRAWFNYKRVNTLKALAEKQAGRLAALEDMAEEIRRDLVPFPNPARPPVVPLPSAIAPRVRSYHLQKVALQNMLVAKLEEIKTALPDDRVEYTRVSDSYILDVIPNRRSSAAQKAKREAVIEGLVPFNQNQAKLYSALAREKEAIRAQVIHEASVLSGKSANKSIEQLLREFAYAFQKQEAWEVYREYETATLEPGLSLPQREILFGAALEKLDLPLAN